MKVLETSRALVCYPVMLACLAFAVGCHSTKTEYEPSVYSGMGAPVTTGSESTSGRASATTYAPTTTEVPAQQGEIAIPIYEEQVVVGTRTVDSGGVRLRKEVTTETVNHPVQVRRETIVVDREAAPGGQAGSRPQAATEGTGKQSGTLGTPFEKGEMVIRLHSEEPVVETRVVPAGRIVVQTRTNAEQQTVQRQVRREKIDVEKLGDSSNVIISDNVGTGESKEAVGSPPADNGKIQGEGNTQGTTQPRAVTTPDEGEPFIRPQPDGRSTFPELHRNTTRP